MEWDEWDHPERLEALRTMFAGLEGKPCVHIDANDGSVYVCRRISDLELVMEMDSVEGMCEWVDPEESRPGELTDGLAISLDCLRFGPDWWLDTYFNWYFVYEPTLVAQSLAGDHSWVPAFLKMASVHEVEPDGSADGKA